MQTITPKALELREIQHGEGGEPDASKIKRYPAPKSGHRPGDRSATDLMVRITAEGGRRWRRIYAEPDGDLFVFEGGHRLYLDSYLVDYLEEWQDANPETPKEN